MPTIQQERGVKSVAGMPERWGRRAYAELSAAMAGVDGYKSERYRALAGLLDNLTGSPLALDMTEAQLCIMAEKCANECANIALDLHDAAAMRTLFAMIARQMGVEPPAVKDDRQAMLRCMDSAWWMRNLRTVHRRTREHAAIRLGLVSSQQGKYCSDEAAHSRVAQNRRNDKVLKNSKVQNVETGQEFTLDVLAAKSTSNNKIRHGELMMRMDGCDDVAQERGDVGLFVTVTAPGSYHAVQEKSGQPNPKYNGATPRDTQCYLRDLWVLTRAKNARDGIAPYGFRVAEPHHDGCTHWHMLVFMPADHIDIFKRNLSEYALAEDGDEYGAKERRVTFEVMDPAQGGAAAYIAKYVGKNIGSNEVKEDKNGKTIITKEMRVEAWASVWGIRQFQPIGQPPVTVYRELRRVPWETVEEAPEHIKAAWLACNRVDLLDEETGEVVGVKRCDWAQFVRAQGGVNMGRDYLIAMATELRAVEGRYGMADRKCPTGIYSKCAPDVEYKSTRYTWRRLGGAVDFDFRRPWSPVNNCTGADAPFWEAAAGYTGEIPPHDDSEWFAAFDFECFDQFGEFNPDLFTEKERKNVPDDAPGAPQAGRPAKGVCAA
jgi:hypothetical protein